MKVQTETVDRVGKKDGISLGCEITVCIKSMKTVRKCTHFFVLGSESLRPTSGETVFCVASLTVKQIIALVVVCSFPQCTFGHAHYFIVRFTHPIPISAAIANL